MLQNQKLFVFLRSYYWLWPRFFFQRNFRKIKKTRVPAPGRHFFSPLGHRKSLVLGRVKKLILGATRYLGAEAQVFGVFLVADRLQELLQGRSTPFRTTFLRTTRRKVVLKWVPQPCNRSGRLSAARKTPKTCASAPK